LSQRKQQGGKAAHSQALHVSHPLEMDCTILFYLEGLRNSLAADTPALWLLMPVKQPKKLSRIQEQAFRW